VLQAKEDASRYATIAKDKHARWQMDSALEPQRVECSMFALVAKCSNVKKLVFLRSDE
jgi:hypothetical protein